MPPEPQPHTTPRWRRPLRVLILSKIFPNASQPLSAPFNRQQFAALGHRCQVEIAATVPWLPGRGPRVPRRETIDGLPVSHPRTPYIPKLPSAALPLYLAALAPRVPGWHGRFDVVLGSWAFPDGCAAIALGRALGVPAAVKLHGSDINVVADLPGPRAILRRMLPRAGAVVAVSRALAARATALGVPEERIHLVYNGVDGALFRVRDQREARRRLGLGEGPLALFVGNLKRDKGVLDLLDAFERLRQTKPAVRLAIVGDGPHRGDCERAAARHPEHLLVVGPQALDEIPWWMAAADVVTLPSWMEGTPNCVLEALACGRPVVASEVGGIPDLITDETLGALVPARDAGALAAALGELLDRRHDAARIAARGARGDWDASADALHAALEAAVVGSVLP